MAISRTILLTLTLLLTAASWACSPALAAGSGSRAPVVAQRADDSGGCDDRPTCGGVDVEVSTELTRRDAVETCYRWYFLQWDSFWWFGDNNWHHYYRPIVCFDGSVITSRDQSSHWQETQGFYHPSGVSHHVVAGCTGCARIQLKAIGNFRWTWGGMERSFSRCANLSVRGNGSWSGWYGC
jgi:hypothetical protein